MLFTYFSICLGVVLKLRKVFWGRGDSREFLTFSYRGGRGSQVATYITNYIPLKEF